MTKLPILLILAAVLSSLAYAGPPAPPNAQEVTFKGSGGIDLSGTLVLPEGKAPVAAFLLLPGSGPTDRDGNVPGVQIDLLKDIADTLAKQGVASLRFDKRAVARYAALWPKDPKELNQFFSYRNFVGDARAAFEFLRSQPGIDSKRVGILGHSEGGLFALQLASDLSGTPEQPDKIILMGTAGRPLGPVIHDQISLRMEDPRVPRDIGRRVLAYSDAACAAIRRGQPLPPDEPKELRGLYNESVMDLLSAYLTVDPLGLAAKYPGPVLILNGADDTQVSPSKDAEQLYKTLHARPAGTATFTLVMMASHNFKSTAGRGRDSFEGPVMPQALSAIADFASK